MKQRKRLFQVNIKFNGEIFTKLQQSAKNNAISVTELCKTLIINEVNNEKQFFCLYYMQFGQNIFIKNQFLGLRLVIK